MTLEDIRARLLEGGWTVFLDRDGVVNVRKYGGYVEAVEEFEFLPGAVDAIVRFGECAVRVVVVTNQRGIALGKMTEADLEEVHGYFLTAVEEAGGRLDAIYHCPDDRDVGSRCRKPEVGMPMQAKEDFPEIDFERSILFGDSPSDLEMGRKLGMVCVHVGPDAVPEELVDLHLNGLWDFWNGF